MKIEFNKEYNFYKVTSDLWIVKDGEEACKEMYCPADTDLEEYRELDDEQLKEYYAELSNESPESESNE